MTPSFINKSTFHVDVQPLGACNRFDEQCPQMLVEQQRPTLMVPVAALDGKRDSDKCKWCAKAVCQKVVGIHLLIWNRCISETHRVVAVLRTKGL